MIIYKITNRLNGKVYVGQTKVSLERRWYQHCHKNSRCTALHNAIVKYGSENFTVEKIDVASTQFELNQKEDFWIEYYNCIVPNGYNLKTGGNVVVYSEDSKRRMSQNHANVHGKNNPRFGVVLSAETKNKISKAHKGKRLSEKQREVLVLNCPRRKPVLNIDNGLVFLSSRRAENYYQLAHGVVSRVCRGEGKTAGGFRWCYVEGGDVNV